MPDHKSKSALPNAVEELVTHLRQQEREVVETKRVINSLLMRMGKDPLFADIDDVGKPAGGRPKVKLGQFFGKPTATAITEYLELANEPVAFSQLMEALEGGGFKFAGKHPERSLKISIGKNMKFVLIGGKEDAVGLRSWFPNLKSSERARATDYEADDEPAGDDPEPRSRVRIEDESGEEADQ